MHKAWANKPMDLHPAGEIRDSHIFQCQGCGDRYTNQEVDEIGGLCPRDGDILRPLGHFEERHRDLWASWFRRRSA